MYTHATIALNQNQTLATRVTSRFPCVFIDEMQDTQRYQDELISNVFNMRHDGLVVQRFGDPDQAIFDRIGSEEPNESFNGKSLQEMDFVIHKSHRFTESIAEKIAKLSFSSIPLEVEILREHWMEGGELQSKQGEFKNTIFVFNDGSISKVIPSFLKVISQQFSESHIFSNDFTVKVIGAVGNEITKDDQLKIGSYCPNFDKKKSNSNFQEETFLETIRYCRQRTGIDWADNYKLLLDCIVKFLRSAGVYDSSGKYFNATTLRQHLTQNENWERFRELFHFWLNPACDLDQSFWNKSSRCLISIFNLNSQLNQVEKYLVFSEPRTQNIETNILEDANENIFTMLPNNIIKHPLGFRVKLSTIHGVKGETHDATLVIETKNYRFDFEVMLPYMIRKLPTDKPFNADLAESVRNKRANKQFMRQLYVGMSRPKHLLCLAIHADHISKTQEQALANMGWRIRRLQS